MLNFIRKAFGSVTGSISDLKNWVFSILSAVYSYIDSEFHAAENAAMQAFQEAYNLFDRAERYIQQVYNYAVSIVDVWGRHLISWVTNLWNTVWSYAKDVYSELVKWVDYLKNAIDTGIKDVVNWVLKEIWDPLFKAITDAANWIGKEGAFMYDLLTHPDKLTKVLAAYIWQSFLDLLKTYAKPIGKWLVHTMMGLAGPVADVLEAIIAALM